jgi:hypothetical protein
MILFSNLVLVAGIQPRDSSAEYPVHDTAGTLTVAAGVVPPEQVHKIFTTDLNRAGYVVVEVAIYPEVGQTVDLSLSDFLLRINSETVRPVVGGAIADILTKREHAPSRSNDVTVVTTATIGRESGVYDPATGRRGSVVYTGAGVGVGVGNTGASPDPAAADRDRAVIQRELEDKSLPEGKTVSAVAGYLYFPKPNSKGKNIALELTYYGAPSQIKLRLPGPVKP